MIWVGWRQQRTEALIAAALLAALAALLVPTGLSMASAYDHGGLASCVSHAGAARCGPLVDAFVARFAKLGDLLAWVTLVPGIIGLLLAAPFVAALEQRTHRLDWTQSITRRRWMAGKLGLAVATALVAAVVLTLLITWWRAPLVRFQGRMENSIYDSEGTVVAAYVLFALGLGLAVGAVWRRTVPALFVGFAGYFATRLFVDTWLRQRLVEPLTKTWSPNGRDPGLDRAWVLSEHPVDAHGHALSLISPCPPGANACPGKPGDVQFMQTVYHPASHFWPLQLRETALFAVMAIALIAFAVWWTLRRD
ncbi:MAG TPA: hypothetical protein VH418_18445 [Solirubrobacteraceae bacterium]|jgi:hypothetical protein